MRGTHEDTVASGTAPHLGATTDPVVDDYGSLPSGLVQAPAAASVALSPRAARFTLLASILGSAMVFLDGTVVNVALPSIQRDLGGGLATQQWIVDAYLLTLGSLILVGGSLGDIFGEVRMFTLGVACFGVASAACAAAPDATTLIVFRGVQGIAGALLTPASLAVITTSFAGQGRGAAIGTWTAWSGISTVVGPLLGGWLIGISTWRVIFLLNVPIALATVAMVLTQIPPRPRVRHDVRVDVAGAAMCAAGLGALVFGFIEQPRLGWGDPAVPLFLQQLAGYSPFRAGLATVPVTIALFLLSRRVGRFSMRFGPRAFMAAGLLVAGGIVGAAGIRNPARA